MRICKIKTTAVCYFNIRNCLEFVAELRDQPRSRGLSKQLKDSSAPSRHKIKHCTDMPTSSVSRRGRASDGDVWLGGRVVMVLQLRSAGRRFISRPVGALSSAMCNSGQFVHTHVLCHQAVLVPA